MLSVKLDKITSQIKRVANLSITHLTKMWGVDVKIYAVDQQFQTAQEPYKNDLQYQNQPYFTGKVLIPFIFRTKMSSDTIINDLIDEDKYMYVTDDRDFDIMSKVIVTYQNKIEKFIIDENPSIETVYGIIMRKYKLVPMVSFDNNVTEIIQNIKDQSVSDANQETISETITSNGEVINDGIIISPL